VASYNFCSELEKSRKTSNDTLAIGTPGGGGGSFTTSSFRGGRLIVFFERRKVTL